MIPIAPEGTRRFPSNAAIDAPGALAQCATGALVACLCGDDTTLERIWRCRSTLATELVLRGVSLVISPAFSMWWGDPPFHGLHEIARTARMAARLARNLDTIPSIVWRTSMDLDRWVDWLSRPSPAGVAVDLSTLTRRREWRWALRSLAHLSKGFLRSGKCPALVAIGPSAGRKVRDLRAAWPTAITVGSRNIWQMSRAGVALNQDGSREKLEDFNFEKLLEKNAATLASHLSVPLREAGSLAAV